MKFLIIMVAAALAGTVTVKAKQKLEPRIVAEHQGRDCCDSRDGLLPPCQSMVYTIENPVSQPVSVELSCGPELIGPTFEIPARVRQQFEVCPEIPAEVHCFIMKWTKK